jgi:hypothetical protein
MSLFGESLYTAKKSPATGLTKLNLVLDSPSSSPEDFSLSGFTGALIAYVSSDNTIVIDLPTTFNNLFQVLTNRQAHPGSATLLFALASIYATGGTVAGNVGKVVWFNEYTGTAPPLRAQYTRIWFVAQKDAGTTYIPTRAQIFIELGITNTSVVGVNPALFE